MLLARSLTCVQRLLNISDSVSGLESKSQSLLALQNLQASTQQRLHRQMKDDLRAVQGVIRNASESATSLFATLQGTSANIQYMLPMMKWGLPSFLDWKIVLLLLFLRGAITKCFSATWGNIISTVISELTC